MWIAIGVGAPVLVLSIAIAVWPVLSRSFRYHRWEHRRSERRHQAFPQRRARADCTLCAASFEAATPQAAVAAKNEHVLRSHAQSGSEAEPATMVVTRGA
jgi:hypothetical protein